MHYKFFNKYQKILILKHLIEDKKLKPKEAEIFFYVMCGYSNDKIKEKTGMSIQYVKYHISNMYTLFDVRNRKAIQLFWRLFTIKDFIQIEKYKTVTVPQKNKIDKYEKELNLND